MSRFPLTTTSAVINSPTGPLSQGFRLIQHRAPRKGIRLKLQGLGLGFKGQGLAWDLVTSHDSGCNLTYDWDKAYKSILFVRL